MKQIVIKRKENSENLILVLEDGILVEKHLENTKNRNIEGNIFVGKVQNVLPGLESAFVNIGKNRNAFIAIKDILPKRDIVKTQELKENDKKINKLIRPGDPIIVQVKKDTSTKKGVRVTTHLNIPGRFVVLCPNTPFITVSQKIKEKERLKKIVLENIPEELGAIVRTNAEKATEEEIILDLQNLVYQWNSIKSTPIENYPKELYDSGGIIKKLLIDIIDANLDEIIVEDERLEQEIIQIFKDLNKTVKLRVDKENILFNYNLDRQIKKAENRKIWLKNGGFITIDKTEALTAIDVNSGKNIGEKSAKETIFNVNYEATIEILKQLRIRDIGGIVIIDYIDMYSEDDKNKIIELLNQEVKKDRSKVQIEGFTKLNLVELTRKHLYNNS